MATLHLPVHSYELRSSQASPSRLVNCFAEQLPPDAKAEALLTRAPGVATWAEVGTGPIHGMHAALGDLYVVSGSKLWQVDENQNATELGSVGVVKNIDMDSNDTSVVVVNEPAAFYWNGTFGQITDSDFTSRGAADVEFLNNYLLFRQPHSGVFFGADLGSATEYDALSFATAEGSPDELVGMKVDHLQALLLGENTGEIWGNDPSAGAFPFSRAVNGFFELGCLNGRTIQKLDNSVFWLASDFTVRKLQGITPVRISTHAIEQKLVDTTYTTAFAWTYSQDGHLFYVLTFPETTLVYDATTQLWHERQSYGQRNSRYGHPVTFAGGVLVGDRTSNKIGRLDPNVYTEFGGVQVMQWTYQPVWAEGTRAFHDRLEAIFEVGVGLTTGQGSNPTVGLEFSDDGGKTWTALPSRSLGAKGVYGHRVIWNALGSSRQRVYRMSVSDPVRVTLVETIVEVRGGRL